jgi:hypothetical protein
MDAFCTQQKSVADILCSAAMFLDPTLSRSLAENFPTATIRHPDIVRMTLAENLDLEMQIWKDLIH